MVSSILPKTIPGKEEFYETLRYFKRRIELLPNIQLRLNHKATYEELGASEFDDIVVATGVTPRHLEIEGIDHPKVLTYLEVLKERKPVPVSAWQLLVRVVSVSIRLNI